MTHCTECGDVARFVTGDGPLCKSCNDADDGETTTDTDEPARGTLGDYGAGGQATLGGFDG